MELTCTSAESTALFFLRILAILFDRVRIKTARSLMLLGGIGGTAPSRDSVACAFWCEALATSSIFERFFNSFSCFVIAPLFRFPAKLDK